MKTIRHSNVILVNAILLVMLFAANISAAGNSLSVSPSQISFGNQTMGTASAPVSITVTNKTRGQIVIRDVSVSTSYFAYSGPPLPMPLNPGQSFTSIVTFTPRGKNAYRGTLTFDRQNGGPISVALSGTGTGTPAVAPTITTQPASQIITAGKTGTFSVAASGTAPITYQWRLNGTAIGGATSASYTTPAETTSNSGAQFSVVVSNSAGNATSRTALLTVSTAASTFNASTSNQWVDRTASSEMRRLQLTNGAAFGRTARTTNFLRSR